MSDIDLTEATKAAHKALAVRWMTVADYLKRARAGSAFVDPPGVLPPFIDALEKALEVVQDEYHADTCCSVLSQEDYPCSCWKSEITNAITEALEAGPR